MTARENRFRPKDCRWKTMEREKMKKEDFLRETAQCPIIPAVKNDEWLKACTKTDSNLIYVIYGDICSISDIVCTIRESGKKAIVHVDLIQGLSSKEISVDFIRKYTDADGIISMKPSLIKRAQQLDLFAIQRFYTIDALTYANVVNHVKNCDPDVVELMPAGLTKVIQYLRQEINKPLMASGLILDKDDVIGALKAGAIAVSTTNRALWEC